MEKTPIKYHLTQLLNMALSDNQLDPSEVRKIYEIAAAKGVSRAEMDVIIEDPGEVYMDHLHTVEEKVELLYDLALIILADNRVDPEEVSLLRDVILQLGFLPENTNTIANFLLENMQAGATKEEIFTAVHQSMQPD